ncbi:DUF4160 domain-containing protein [Pseudomonadota bacterium]
MSQWVVAIDQSLVRELAEDFQRGPLLESGKRQLDEQLVAWLDGLKIEIFSREHPPPHFHVVYQGKSNNFDICTGEPLEGSALRKWHNNIRAWHEKNRKTLIDTWNSTRPSDCPVGRVEC